MCEINKRQIENHSLKPFINYYNEFYLRSIPNASWKQNVFNYLMTYCTCTDSLTYINFDKNKKPLLIFRSLIKIQNKILNYTCFS